VGIVSGSRSDESAGNQSRAHPPPPAARGQKSAGDDAGSKSDTIEGDDGDRQPTPGGTSDESEAAKAAAKALWEEKMRAMRAPKPPLAACTDAGPVKYNSGTLRPLIQSPLPYLPYFHRLAHLFVSLSWSHPLIHMWLVFGGWLFLPRTI
jgi:hypothetical protein